MTAIAKSGQPDQALLDGICTRGEDILDTPFQGEPIGLEEGVRRDLWRMRILEDHALVVSLKKKADGFDIRKAVCTPAMVVLNLILIPGIATNYIGHSPDELMSSFVYLMLILAVSSTASILACSHRFSRMDAVGNRITALLGNARDRAWPSRLLTFLLIYSDRVSMSDELLAMKALLKGLGNDTNKPWTDISMDDQIAMSRLTQGITDSLSGLGSVALGATPDVSLALTGENSELLHRVCDQATPGALEEAIGKIRRASSPKTIRV